MRICASPWFCPGFSLASISPNLKSALRQTVNSHYRLQRQERQWYNTDVLFVLLTISTFAIALLAARTSWALRRFTYRPSLDEPLPNDPPTVSVCIAARNETHALAHCLERVLKSDYPKLEILVLDDSSTDDTSLIIKSFAHAGVRFIPGLPLPEGWLGKNHAYQTLIDEASGDMVLFIDVDTHIGESTVSRLVAQLNSHGRSMISVLPRRHDGLRASAVLGTMRYYWELLLTTNDSPPASSALWMVRLDTLKQAGIGLMNYGMSVRPERHLARQLQRDKRYFYLIGTPELEVTYEKRLQSQYETALRLYYPMNGRTIARFILAVLFLCALLAPLALAVSGQGTVYTWWALVLIIAVALTFGLFTRRTYARPAWLLRTALGPLLVVQELLLLLVSYWQYRLGRVTWKGRLVNAQPSRRDSIRMDN